MCTTQKEIDALLYNFRNIEFRDLNKINYVVLSFLIIRCTETDVFRLINVGIDFTRTIEDPIILLGEVDSSLLEIVISDDNVELADFIICHIPKEDARQTLSRIWIWQWVESSKMTKMLMKYKDALVKDIVCPRVCPMKKCDYCHPLLYSIERRKFVVAKAIVESCPSMAKDYGPKMLYPIFILMSGVLKQYDLIDVQSFYDLFELLLEHSPNNNSNDTHHNCIGMIVYKNIVYYALHISSKLQDSHLIDILLKKDYEPSLYDLMNAAEFGMYEDFVKLFSVYYTNTIRGSNIKESQLSYRFMSILATKWRVDIYEYILTVYGHPGIFFYHFGSPLNRKINELVNVNDVKNYDITLFSIILTRMNIMSYVDSLKIK